MDDYAEASPRLTLTTLFFSVLFEGVFQDLLPKLKQNWLQRNQRPLPESIKYARLSFEKIWVADGSTLEALLYLSRCAYPVSQQSSGVIHHIHLLINVCQLLHHCR
jgi:hypothetical protein